MRRTEFAILMALIAFMAVTRFNHFDALPDGSWAAFFIGGHALRRFTAWAFPLLMLLAITVDVWVIQGQGISFWQHYCVSIAYWMLIPAYFCLWAGGMWLAGQTGSAAKRIALGAISLLLAVALCQLISQGSFYWLSDSVPHKSFSGWFRNYSTWLWPYLQTTTLYVAAAAGIGAAFAAIARPTQTARV
ncbi:MAG: hypothetical protein Q4B94_10890 [Pseudomonadota bacterium]|nr:hypothetical protein [Pseudomonadota bacterium]